jgi:hypothetical protein
MLKLRRSRQRPVLHFPKSLCFPLQLDGFGPTSTNQFSKADRRWGMDRSLGACRDGAFSSAASSSPPRESLSTPHLHVPLGAENSLDGLPFTEVPRKRGAHVRNPPLEHVDDRAIGVDHFPLRFSTTVHEMKSKDVEEATKNAPLSA